jgi:asparagine synthase (glutamine-hydrolysing)
MCGICGVVLSSRAKQHIDVDVLVRMRDTLTHRGPDDEGLYIDEQCGLGHRRLSIIDVAGGHQPMSSDDGTLHIVYNGEVYNHSALRTQLERRGHRYRTRCDTETVLRAYQQEGPRSVERLRGMFAYAVWDRNERQLFLARDRLGIKPLYYATTSDGSLYFASEIKALLATGAVRAALNLSALPDYLANHATSGSETLFAGVHRLLPGHTLVWRNGRIDLCKYWDLTFGAASNDALSTRAVVEEFDALFRQAVELRLMSDVPLGLFLSGGIDSASIAAVMSELVDEPVKTFSVAFAERSANELEYARLAAHTFRTDHHEILLTPSDFFAALPRLIWHEDEPLAHPSSVALNFVARLAAERVKVVLTGEGSDELLAGYGRYWKTVYNMTLGGWYHRLTPLALRGAIRTCIQSDKLSRRVRDKLARTFLVLPADLESIYFDNFAVFSRSHQSALLAPDVKARLNGTDPYGVALDHLSACDADNDLDRLLYIDAKTYLHELLMKQDQMSMAASLESRVPFLDHLLAEFVASLPTTMKLRGLTTKYLLRRSMKGRLPRDIMRRRKMGFPVPLGGWLRGEYAALADDCILGERSAARGLFDRVFLKELLSEHRDGRVDHSQRLWSLINLELWQRIFLDGEGPGELAVSNASAGEGAR